jgi:5-formyltetrahydrofolate cyclo-ligase
VEPVRGRETVTRADVVLVPALAVDGRGSRLGRGGGSYDRALARVFGRVPTIALLYDDELLDYVPAEPHDRAVRAVAQPSHGITWMPELDAIERGISGATGQLDLAVCCGEC